MVINRNEMRLIPYTTSFTEKFIVKDDMNLLLNKISVYGCIYNDLNKVCQKKVNFDIRIINDKKAIYPLDDYEEYLLCAERLAKVDTIEIKASDYVEKIEHNGDFTFIVNEEEDK